MKLYILFLTLILSIAFLLQLGIQHSAFSIQQPTSCTLIKWFDPNSKEKEAAHLLKNCSNCHMAYYKEWINDPHSMSNDNSLFLSIYSGTDKNGKKNIYPGFKLDHPKQNGNCALCHNPEAALDNNLDVDARKKSNRISCNFCHKIESVDENSLKKGIKGLKVVRVCEGLQDIGFGPLDDLVESTDVVKFKYNPLYKTSLYCAKCHDGLNGNTRIYSTFTEWQSSPAAKRGVQCQSCHMPFRGKEKTHFVDNPNVKSKLRPYYQIHNHSFLTGNPHEFRKKHVDLTVRAGLKPAPTNGHKILILTCKVSNKNTGHNFPTGSPMRNAILLVTAKDKNGNNLRLIKGPKLPNYAGDLRGKPGKLFAKILSETNSQYATQHGKGGIEFRKVTYELGIPSQDWWNVFILNDTRIKSNKSDVSIYEFNTTGGKIEITAKLIWRNTWEGLAKVKDLELKEDLLIEKKIRL